MLPLIDPAGSGTVAWDYLAAPTHTLDPLASDSAAERARFKKATDTLQACGVTLPRVAAAFGVALNTVNKWRAETSILRPRAGWEHVVGGLAMEAVEENRGRAERAAALAAELSS